MLKSSTELAKNVDLAALVDAWHDAKAEILYAHELLGTAEARLKGNFNADDYKLRVVSHHQEIARSSESAS